MRLRPIVLSGILALAMAGCYQQATDSFETINSSGQSQPVAPTATVLFIDPNQGQDDPTPTQDVVVIVPATATDEPLFMPPTATDVPFVMPATATDAVSVFSQPEATPTVVVIVPQLPSSTPFPTPEVLLATSTPITVITPQAPVQLVIPTATPTLAGASAQTGTTVNTSGIFTPTALPEFVPPECVYVVRGGDNLFRIALNNGVSLADLLAVNGLSERSVIQPNQELRLPNCQATITTTTIDTTTTTGTTTTTDGGSSAPVPLQGTGTTVTTTGAAVASQAVHRVASGETLFSIARRYGVTIQAIVDTNQLTNPDRLSVGQELVIPPR